ncbi:hypothetical protein GCM10019059_36140 [Camelimonas fluminis]|nr:hypothetical protein GCM10019059_36140 [Camelimonas fluminis]
MCGHGAAAKLNIKFKQIFFQTNPKKGIFKMSGKLQVLIAASLAYVNSRASQERIDRINAGYEDRIAALKRQQDAEIATARDLGGSALAQYEEAFASLKASYPDSTDERLISLLQTQARVLIEIGDVSTSITIPESVPGDVQADASAPPTAPIPASEATVHAVNPTHHEPAAAAGSVTEAPRRRGRPRKNPLAPVESPIGDVSGDNDETEIATTQPSTPSVAETPFTNPVAVAVAELGPSPLLTTANVVIVNNLDVNDASADDQDPTAGTTQLEADDASYDPFAFAPDRTSPTAPEGGSDARNEPELLPTGVGDYYKPSSSVDLDASNTGSIQAPFDLIGSSAVSDGFDEDNFTGDDYGDPSFSHEPEADGAFPDTSEDEGFERPSFLRPSSIAAAPGG